MKQTGLGDNLYISGVDVSGDTQSLGKIGGGPAALDVTDITQSAYERRGGIRDGAIEWVSYFDPATAHPVLSALLTTDAQLMYSRGTVFGSQVACLVGKQVDYTPTRGADGSLTFAVSAQANGYGVEWGDRLTDGFREDTAATNGTDILDAGAASSFGLQAYLQLLAFTGTSVTVKLQESSDGGVTDEWADVVGGAFTAATAVGAERIETSRTLAVERHLRVVTTGTFTVATFAVAVVRNATAVVFSA
jgi:hypothetical protein